MFELDSTTAASLLSLPEKLWVSYGIVEPDAPGARSVQFQDDQGNPLQQGVLVLVKLSPCGIVVPCRVSSPVGGAGAAEYHPFVAGDEVLVVLPSGNGRAGPVIVGRLNQSADVFPAAVAGQATTNNSVGFRRCLEPIIYESGTALQLRCSNTGAQLAIDQMGQVTITDGEMNGLFFTTDGVTLKLNDDAAALQLIENPITGDPQVVLAVGSDTAFSIDGTQTQFQSTGLFSFSTLGNQGSNHAVSVEALGDILQAFANSIILAFTTTPMAPTLTSAAIATLLTTVIGPPTYAGVAAAFATAAPIETSLVPAAIKTALSEPKGPGLPGIGSQGVLID